MGKGNGGTKLLILWELGSGAGNSAKEEQVSDHMYGGALVHKFNLFYHSRKDGHGRVCPPMQSLLTKTKVCQTLLSLKQTVCKEKC